MVAGIAYTKTLFAAPDRVETSQGASAKSAAIMLLKRHMIEVMSQLDSALRWSVMPEIYLPNCFVSGPDEAIGCGRVQHTRYGYSAVNDAARRVQRHRAGHRFDLGDSAADESDVAALRWLFRPEDGPADYCGIEIALCASGRIEACFSMLDDPANPLDLRQVCASLASEGERGARRSHQSWVRDAHDHVASAAH